MRRLPNGWIVFFLLAFTYAYFYHEPEWNGNSRLALTAAIVQEGRLTIDSFYDRTETGYATGDTAFYNGHYYSDKAIGSSLLAAPPFALLYWGSRLLGHPIGPWLLKHLLTFLLIGLPFALAGALIYQACEQISGGPLRAGVVTAAVALGTMAFPFSLLYFSHALVAALLWITFFLIFRLRFRESPPGTGYALLCGLLPGLALISEYTTALIILPLLIYYLYVLWQKRASFRVGAVLYPVLGGLLPVFLLLGYNLLVYGQPLVSGYQYLVNPAYREAMSHGIMGIGLPNLTALFFMTLQPAMGLFWQSPALLLVIPGAIYLLRDRCYRVEGALALFIFIAYLVVMSGYFEWWGARDFAPRHLIPMLPFLCLPLIFVPRRIFPLLGGLTVLSIAQMLLVAATVVLVPDTRMNHYTQLGFFDYSTIYSYCLPAFMKGDFAWNLGSDLLGLHGWLSLIPLLLAIAGVAWYLWHAPARS